MTNHGKRVRSDVPPLPEALGPEAGRFFAQTMRIARMKLAPLRVQPAARQRLKQGLVEAGFSAEDLVFPEVTQ